MKVQWMVAQGIPTRISGPTNTEIDRFIYSWEDGDGREELKAKAEDYDVTIEFTIDD